MADEPDIPMLDVGDFEVLDECIGEDENEEDHEIISYGSEVEEIEDDYDDHHHNPKRQTESERRRQNDNMDENSADHGDNVLDVSIDVEENEFLENVAKDFSENIEEEVEERPQRITRLSSRRSQPAVQIRRINTNAKKEEEKPEESTPRKRPGPKSKTMNVQPQKTPVKPPAKTPVKPPAKTPVKPPAKTPVKPPAKTPIKAPVTAPTKKPIQKITFSDDKPKEEKKVEKTQSQTSSNVTPQEIKSKPEPNVQTKKTTPAFLKKDLTDEEIMEHFDEIENTVVASDSLIIHNDTENDLEEKEKEAEEKEEENKDENKGENQDENQDENQGAKEEDANKDTNTNDNEENKKEENQGDEENWDDCDEHKKIPHIKIEREVFKDSEMWYAEKLKTKENVVEEKFTKLAKVIQYSYPMYKNWLDKNESLFGTAICKVETSKHSPLDQLHPNRWKFVCNKKQIQQSSKEEDKQDDNTSDNKNAQFSWQVIPGVQDANVENTDEYPTYVMRVVKVFEEFLQSLNKPSDENTKDEQNEADVEVKIEENEENKTTNKSEADNEKSNEKEKTAKNIEGLTILLRSNRKDDLMMHVTGKNMSDELMAKIKDLFENGPGKDCNVKSLHCKTIIKEDNLIKTNNTFLLGSETLEDSVGDIKVHLAPKGNIWANLPGVEVLANVVAEYLVPTKKTTILDIGCGKGLISLLLASKCQKVIGIDVQNEILEGEITCQLNGIPNVSFMTGKPKILMGQIEKTIANSKVVAVINTNNPFGRSLEIISAIRKMSVIGRIVIITTLTKQSIRSILELMQPADDIKNGNPFIPSKACIVDTTPKAYGFEIVMTMQRRTMHNFIKASEASPVGLISKSKQVAALKYGIPVSALKKAIPGKFTKGYKGKPIFIQGKKFFITNPSFNPTNKFGKRPFPDKDPVDFNPGKKFKSWQGNIRLNPMHDKKLRDEGDLRERLSSNRVEPIAIVKEMKEQRKLLDAARDKLSGAASSVDVETVKKLQEMLNLAIEKTNKLQSQLPPRSVWDRIAPPEIGIDEDPFKTAPMKGRLVKETGVKEIIITTSNNRDRDYEIPSASGKSKKYDNLPPAEPNLILPVDNKKERLKITQSVVQKPSSAPYQKPGPNRFAGPNYRKPDPGPETWNRSKPPASQIQDRWSRPSPPRRTSPPRTMVRSPPPRQSSPPRRPLSPARRPMSPPRRPMSPPRRPMSPPRRLMSPPRRPVSPPRRPASPGFRPHSSAPRNTSGRPVSPPRRHSPPRRPASPHYRGSSPPRQARQKSPPPRRYADEWDIPSRGAIAESGWGRTDKDKWAGPPQASGWNQTSTSANRFRESDKWDNPTPPSSWGNKNPLPPAPSNPRSGWKGPSNPVSGSNWDVKNDNAMRDSGRREPRHESRHEPPRHEPRIEPRHESRPEPRHEPRWEPPPRNEKDDWGDLPEDARDPWDDLPPAPPKDNRWSSQPNQPNPPSNWGREPPSDSWSNKPQFPMNNMSGGPGGGMNSMSNMNMNMGGGIGMNNPNKPMWQNPQPPQSNRNSNWLPPQNNWQGGGGGGMGGGMGGGIGGGLGALLGNAMSNWQPPQQNFSNFPSRPFNNPFMNNRR